MFRPLTATATFNHPASSDEVWAAFTDVPRWPEVLTDLQSVGVEPDGELAPGVTIKTIARPDRNVINMTYSVVEAEPARRLVLASAADGFSAHTIYEFTGANENGGTTVVVTAHVTPRSLVNRITSQLWPHKFN